MDWKWPTVYTVENSILKILRNCAGACAWNVKYQLQWLSMSKVHIQTVG